MGQTTLDHLAVGVRRWPDSYARFVHTLGGRWSHGGEAGDFAPYQLDFGDCMRLEFIAPSAPGGFMERFLDRHGPSAHHVTFKVPRIEDTVADARRRGFETFSGRPDMPVWREMFVHPKVSGLGTLVQIVEADDEAILRETRHAGRPADFPEPSVAARPISHFGVTAIDVTRARELLIDVLHGTVADEGDGWFAATWGPGRTILVRKPGVEPGDVRLWAGTPHSGVAFLVVGATGEPRPLPPDATTGLPVWLAGGP